MGYTIVKDVDRWYVCIAVETDHKLQRKQDLGVVGVDLGVKVLATLSDGTVFENQRPYKKKLNRIKRLSRRLAKKQKGSNNRIKTKVKLAKVHRKVRLIREVALHKLTTHLVQNYSTVIVEDLNISGMVKNHNLASCILDSGFGIFRTMLENKCSETESKLLFSDRFYPSSKTCSNCGNVKKTLKLSERVYCCNNCNFSIDRDLNAAINLRSLGACCADVKPVEIAVRSMNQEKIGDI
jgi:putative transposase